MNESIVGLGVDQGIAHCGYSVVELTPSNDIHILTSGTIETSSKQELSSRVLFIYQTIKHLSKEYNVKILGCEKLFFSPPQKTDNKGFRNKSASIVYTNMATGLLYLISGENQIPIKEFVPGTIKKYVTGNGRATKEEVWEAVSKFLPMDKKIKTEHEADSIAIGITTVFYLKNLEEKKLKKRK